jgi:hypothetical protein
MDQNAYARSSFVGRQEERDQRNGINANILRMRRDQRNLEQQHTHQKEQQSLQEFTQSNRNGNILRMRQDQRVLEQQQLQKEHQESPQSQRQLQEQRLAQFPSKKHQKSPTASALAFPPGLNPNLRKGL